VLECRSEWKTTLGNAASVGLAKKLGFIHIGNEFFISSATKIEKKV